MSKFFRSIVTLVVLFAILVVPQTAAADLVPSKTAPQQSLASREADLQFVRSIVAQERVADALANQGFTTEQVNERIAQLSDQELHSLAQNLNQVQAAGVTSREWLWILTGAVVVLLILVAVD